MKKRQYRGSRKVRKNTGIANGTAETHETRRMLERRRWIWMISDLIVAVLLMLALEVMRKNQVLDHAIRARTPPLVFSTAGSVVLITTAIRFFEIIFNFKRLITDTTFALRMYRILAFLEALRAAAVVLLLMYGFGAIAVGASLLPRAATFLSERASYYISTALGWLASGVVGNLAYDLLKRSVVPRRSRRLRTTQPTWRSIPPRQ